MSVLCHQRAGKPAFSAHSFAPLAFVLSREWERLDGTGSNIDAGDRALMGGVQACTRFLPWLWGTPTAGYECSTVRTMQAAPGRPGTGMHVIGACFPHLLQRGSGGVCMHLFLILHEVRQRCTTRNQCHDRSVGAVPARLCPGTRFPVASEPGEAPAAMAGVHHQGCQSDRLPTLQGAQE